MAALRFYCEHCDIFVLAQDLHCPVCQSTVNASGAFCSAESSPYRLPRIFVKATDKTRLYRLALEAGHGNTMVQEFLINELNRARICNPVFLPADTVAMNTRVRFRISHLPGVEDRYLVYPPDYEPTGDMISVMSPIGAALIGLRAGDSMPLQDLQGQDLSVTVESASAS